MINDKKGIKTLGIIGNTNSYAVGYYCNTIKNILKENKISPDRFDFSIYSAKFRSFDKDISKNWNFNGSKLAYSYINITSNGARRLIFCDPVLHLLLEPGFISIPIVDHVSSIVSHFKAINITRVACFGINTDLLKRYFHSVNLQGVTLFLVDEIYSGYSTDEEKERFIATLHLRTVEAILVHDSPEIEKFIRSKHIVIPIFTTWHIHAIAAARYFIDDSL
jgi:aspartate/glutamate racemase